MRQDPLLVASWILELGDRSVGPLIQVDFPTETSMTLEFGSGVDRALFDWMARSVEGKPVPMSGSLVVLDSSLNEAYRDAWDWGVIQQIVFPALDAQTAALARYYFMVLRISNLREVPKKPIAPPASKSSGRRDPLNPSASKCCWTAPPRNSLSRRSVPSR